MFALGLIPSGSKDPFALRRQANGIVKTIAEHKLPLRLSEVMADARVRYKGSEAEKKFSNAAYAESVRSFFRERLEFYLKDARGYAYDVVSAVLAVDSDDVVDAAARAEAVSKVRGSADFESISSAFKRMKNILRQASEKTKVIAMRVDSGSSAGGIRKRTGCVDPADCGAWSRNCAMRATMKRRYSKLRSCARRSTNFSKRSWSWWTMTNLRANRLALLQTVVKGILHDSGFLRDRDRRQGIHEIASLTHSSLTALAVAG